MKIFQKKGDKTQKVVMSLIGNPKHSGQPECNQNMQVQFSREVGCILKTGLFDKEYYEQECGESFSTLDKAISHYIDFGAVEGFDPCAVFSTSFYLRRYSDIADAGVNPLVHYIEYGGRELREPCLVFKPEYFLSQLTFIQRQEAQKNPLVYYMKNPTSARPICLFDAEYYNSQLKIAVAQPLSHYLKEGYKRGLAPHPLFNTKFFRENNNVDENRADLVSYCELPFNSHVKVQPLFDAAYYEQSHPEVSQTGIDYLSHYILIGSNSNFWPNPLFWPSYYMKAIGISANKYDSILTHYVLEGECSSHSPNPWFDIPFYLDSYKFVAEDYRGPFAHYYYDGWKHDFMPSEQFSPRFMRSRYGIPADTNPLQHYIHHMAGTPMLPQRAWYDSEPEYRQLQVVQEQFSEETVASPKVTVIVPIYNNYSYTLRCLYSIAISKNKTSYEVIIADDCSSDESREKFSNIKGIKYARNSENIGFLRSCNNASLLAKGEYIFLLNNDTAVLNGWLDTLVATFEENENVGLVGSKLLYPNGLLQEAGGVLWSNGAANIGKFDDPKRPDFSYLRQVDYISGAAIMVPTGLWNVLGGFDERYAPAYCEDSDLCLQVRNMGYRVMMQPSSKIVHFEGISSGTDLNSGVKKYQVINSEKLKQKWKNLLSKNGIQGDFSRKCVNRDSGPRILIIDATIPTPDQDAGSVTVWYFLKIFRQLGYQVTFIPENLFDISPYTEMVQSLGVECLYHPYLNDIDSYIQQLGHNFDVVMLYRVGCAGRFFETTRKFAPNAKIIFDTVDLHFLREERQAKMEKDKQKSAEMLANAYETRNSELYLLKNADISIVLSHYEKDMLSRDWGIDNTFVIPIVLEVPGSKTTYSERKDIAFIGGYQHTPNVDAVLYFVETIWPKVKEKIDGVKFYVIGSKPPAEILELQEKDEDIIVTGFVESLDPYMDSLRLTVAPLRFGAGIKGKIGSSLSYGVPCIANKVAAEGMGLTNGKNILMSSEEATFIENLVSTYNNGEAWNSLSKEGMEFVRRNYSISAIRNRLLCMLNSIKAAPFCEKSPFSNRYETMRLSAPPYTDQLLCETNSSTISNRMLARDIIQLARSKGLIVSNYKEAVLLLQTNGISVTPLKELDNCLCLNIESVDMEGRTNKVVGLLELDAIKIKEKIDFFAILDESLNGLYAIVIYAIKGDLMSDAHRRNVLNWIYEYCSRMGLHYCVNAQENSYLGQRHIGFHVSL